MKARTRKALFDYYRAAGVSEMSRREKKRFKTKIYRAMKNVERDDPTAWDKFAVLYPGFGPTPKAKNAALNFNDTRDTDASFRLNV